ncbi:MAG: glycosyltransferase [Candidatus Marinimicrobia bacterium]|nr:glycosyltransferase [Candidatus Neomarinimicrobiota bacterium]MCF7828587.1 glycosyltransferase [Candidatus Neomarinimicrobiota bacterium]MCF7880328.1 glycosyltransferase [Candidatus Neomarinimicrobiota bacterium]
MTVLSILLLVPLGLLLLVALFNAVFTPRLQKHFPVKDSPKVSVLVPVRNEEETLPRCLLTLTEQDYGDFEILVLDDGSTDKTPDIIREFAEEHARVHYIPGEPLPEEWSGKNWACHQLSAAATGDILLFTDADNWYRDDAISRTIGWMQQYELGMLSAFPEQSTHTLAEQMIIPIMDLLVYAGLPLWLTYYTKFPSLAAANGQWMAFSREAYNAVAGHASVCREIAEDTALARRVKQAGIPMLTMAGTGVVFGRMYKSFNAIKEGFTKNLFSLMNRRTRPYFILVAIVLFVTITPYVLVFVPGFSIVGTVGVLLQGVMRLIVAVRFWHPPVISAVLHPVSISIFAYIAVNSFFKTKSNAVVWKDRTIALYNRG